MKCSGTLYLLPISTFNSRYQLKKPETTEKRKYIFLAATVPSAEIEDATDMSYQLTSSNPLLPPTVLLSFGIETP
jgi:hypothetical protein